MNHVAAVVGGGRLAAEAPRPGRGALRDHRAGRAGGGGGLPERPCVHAAGVSDRSGDSPPHRAGRGVEPDSDQPDPRARDAAVRRPAGPPRRAGGDRRRRRLSRHRVPGRRPRRRVERAGRAGDPHRRLSPEHPAGRISIWSRGGSAARRRPTATRGRSSAASCAPSTPPPCSRSTGRRTGRPGCTSRTCGIGSRGPWIPRPVLPRVRGGARGRRSPMTRSSSTAAASTPGAGPPPPSAAGRTTRFAARAEAGRALENAAISEGRRGALAGSRTPVGGLENARWRARERPLACLRTPVGGLENAR